MQPEERKHARATTPQLASQYISFTEVPEATLLYLDFLYHFERVKEFYVERSVESLAAFAKQLSAQKYERDLLVEVLLDQNRRFGADEETLANIRRLADPKTVAIVTGQQAGLFTGPVYTLYKALAAIKLSRQLNEQGFSTVPIFWIEGEDHDQAEINHCGLVDRQGQWREVVYAIDPGEADKPVGHIIIQPSIRDVVNELLDVLPSSEFIPQITQDLQEAYAPGVTLADAFGRLLARWLAGTGLVLLDPMDARLKRLLAKLFETGIQRASEIAYTLMSRSQKLVAAGYHAQLYTTEEQVPLFIESEGKRVGLVNEGSGFALKNGAESYRSDELIELAHEHPGRFSPGVALRPIVQDTLLPTLTYIAGPSEIAYFAQLNPLYSLLSRPTTPLWPRASFTIVERRYAKVLDKYQLRFEDVFAGFDQMMRHIVEQKLAAETATLFDEAESVFTTKLDQIRQALTGVDPTLAQAASTAQEKVLYQIQHLRTRFTQARAKSEEVAYQQLQALFRVLYPDGTLQERRLNVLHFFSRYDQEFLEALLKTMDVWQPDHQIIYVK
jgi:bacillithiol biosynthesis cysteine-adding enzyme BshC